MWIRFGRNGEDGVTATPTGIKRPVYVARAWLLLMQGVRVRVQPTHTATFLLFLHSAQICPEHVDAQPPGASLPDEVPVCGRPDRGDHAVQVQGAATLGQEL
jgi:hypothetical protein